MHLQYVRLAVGGGAGAGVGAGARLDAAEEVRSAPRCARHWSGAGSLGQKSPGWLEDLDVPHCVCTGLRLSRTEDS
eukprot:scaffold1523_cov140-Isochrysis_galbana.AAC.5